MKRNHCRYGQTSSCDCCKAAYCPYGNGEFEHFNRMIYETNNAEYWCSSKGYAWRVPKVGIHKGEKIRFKAIMHGGQMRICIKTWPEFRNSGNLKRLVYYTVRGHWPDGCLIPIDGNEENCNYTNLKLVPQLAILHEHGGKAKCQPVIVTGKDGTETRYRSVRAAAKALYVSYQTLSDFLNKVSGSRYSVLHGTKVRYERESDAAKYPKRRKPYIGKGHGRKEKRK